MWELRLKTVTLPRITQVGTSGADAKLALALSFVLSPIVFSVRGLPAGLECTLLRGKHIRQTSEADSTETEDKCYIKLSSLVRWKTTGVNQKEK